MKKLYKEIYEINLLDSLTEKNTFLHILKAKSKIFTTFFFLLILASFHKYSVSSLMPLFIYPVFLISAGKLPFKYIAKKILFISPFAIFVGLFNPFFDKKIIFSFWGADISGGWISFFSIILRFVLATTSVFAMIALTSMNSFARALLDIGLPSAFVTQLFFLNRYMLTMLEEGEKIFSAVSIRSFGQKMSLKIFSFAVGGFLMKTIDRGERIYSAMLLRGFNGQMQAEPEGEMSAGDFVFIFLWCSFFIVCRFFNLSFILGGLAVSV